MSPWIRNATACLPTAPPTGAGAEFCSTQNRVHRHQFAFHFPWNWKLQMGSVNSTTAVGKLCTGVTEVIY